MPSGGDRLKERRRERMERIRMQVRDSMPPYLHDIVDPVETRYTASSFPFSSQSEEEQPPIAPQEKIGVQIFLSLFLLGSIWLMFKSSTPLPAAWKETVREVMTRDFNFEGVSAWYQEKFGHVPTILPVLTPTNKAVPAQGNAVNQPWHVAGEWKVVKPYDPASSKLILAVEGTGQIKNGELGWVTFVGDKPGYGLTVVVQMTGNREAWYGNMEAVAVEKDEMVNPGDVLGVAGASAEKSRLLYLGVRENQQFIDPLDVIPLE
ncbi:MAG TPA: M23 family metallopeptidase [Candidatus Bathyarchaeia archaeon]|nr:M23 family metallopeptidase [Candidatus Bathyarchaeia archaeon]